MKKNIFVCLFILFGTMSFSQSLTNAQRMQAETAVKDYFSLLSQYVRHPMGDEALKVREDIIFMFENMYNTPVYNDLTAFGQKTNLGTSCTIDDYLLSFGLLNDMEEATFSITYDSIVCKPLQEPSYAEGYDNLNAMVYVNKYIEGAGISEKITNVVRYNLSTNKISYIEKASFSTNQEDVNFLLKNQLGYSTSKLNEMASRCYEEGKYRQAYLLYEQAAIRDDMNSQFSIANMLYKRQGCEEYAPFVTFQMAKFWLKKIYFKYIQNDGVKLHDIGLFRPINQLINIVFEDEKKFESDMEQRPFNSGLMKYKIPGEKLYGFVDPSGELIVPAIYEWVSPFSEGLAVVKKNDKYGYINIKGDVVIPLKYKTASIFINGTASVGADGMDDAEGKRLFFIINKKGERISEFFDYIGYRVLKTEMLLCARRGNKWGFIDGLGKIKVPFIYDDFRRRNVIFAASEDIPMIAILKDGEWGFIDISYSEGRIVLLPQFKNVGSFSFGLSWVDDGNGLSFVNRQGKIVCGKYITCTPFNAGGLAVVRYKPGKDVFLINKRGEIVYTAQEENGVLSDIQRRIRE